MDWVPRIDGEALGTTDGGDGVRVDERQGQPVARNRAPGIGKVNGEGVAEGLWICKGGRGDGVKNGSIH